MCVFGVRISVGFNTSVISLFPPMIKSDKNSDLERFKDMNKKTVSASRRGCCITSSGVLTVISINKQRTRRYTINIVHIIVNCNNYNTNTKSFINHYKYYTQMRSLNISRSIDDDDYEFTQLRNCVKPYL